MANQKDSSKFSLDKYDCIGFDLDCTLAEYNLKELMKLIYDLLVKYLVERKSYDGEFLRKPFEEGEDFLQKGLIMDLKKGNILKITEDGVICKASHGTSILTESMIIEQYGPNKTYSIIKEFVDNPMSVINTPHEKLIRGTLDCFDMPCVLLFARIVDSLDKVNGHVSNEYNIWPDILEGLYQIYSRNHYASGESEFFARLRENPDLYYKKWDEKKLLWLKELKAKKFTFVLTGSFIDFATLTANTCIGSNWKDYFDVILCYGRKPYFFFANHPFLSVECGKETEAVNSLTTNSVYSQGNWQALKLLISKHTNIKEPKCLYVGDNLIQDVFSPVYFKCCDSVAVSNELKEEYKNSKFWGSYFVTDDKVYTYWNSLINNYARLCVSDLKVFSEKPITFEYDFLKQTETNTIDTSSGYYTS